MTIRNILLALLSGLLLGCLSAPYETTKITPVATNKPRVGKTIMVGLIDDNRFPFWPREEASPPIVKGDEQKQIKEFEPIPESKEVRIPMGEVRSRLSGALKISGRFDEIISPPATLIGKSLPAMLKTAMESSDYLVVGEVNSFHSKGLGINKVGYFTLPFDLTVLGLPNLVVILLTGGRALLLTTGIFPGYTVEALLSMSFTVYSVETGRALTTIRVEKRALIPADTVMVFGDIHNPKDDWIDLGRRLGEVALANGCAQAVDEIAEAIAKDNRGRSDENQ